MTDLLETVLLQGLNSELKGNRIAAILYGLVNSGKIFTSNRMEVIVELIKGNPPKDENLITKTPVNSPEFKDMRLLNVALCNIKKYPGSISENKFYGVSFADENGDSLNSVFIGSNGVGKTSLYAALEYAGMRKMNTAAIRGYSRKIGQQVDVTVIPEKDQSEFLLHSGSRITGSSIRMFSKYEALVLDGKDLETESGKPLVTEAFFCSDYDVRMLEASKDYTDFFLKQIGLSHFYKALQDLYALRYHVDSYESERNKKLSSLSDCRQDEIKYRLLIGIVEGVIKVDISSFENDIIIDQNLQQLRLNQDKTELIITINQLRDILINELKAFPAGNWHTIELKREYQICIKNIAKSKRLIVKDDKTGLMYFWEQVGDFLSYRKDLIDSIKELLQEMESATSARDKIDINNSLYELYVLKRKDLDWEKAEWEESQLFESDEAHDKFDKEYNQLIDYMEGYLHDTLNDWIEDLKNAVDTMLGEYFEIDNDKLHLSIDFRPSQKMIMNPDNNDSSPYFRGIVHPFLEIKVEVMSSRGELQADKRFPEPPRAYLNTFKFKLFCIVLKLGLCCFVKKNFNMNFPLIIDDVFDSSDFENRIKLKDFVKYMIDQHNKLLKDEKFRPQIIFFTQDDLIADQVYRGICEASTNVKAKLSLIFDYHECDEKDIVNIKFKGDNYTYKSVEDVITQHNQIAK